MRKTTTAGSAAIAALLHALEISMTLTPEERAKAAETARIGTRAAAKTAFGMYLKLMGIAALVGLVLMLGMCSMLFHALR